MSQVCFPVARPKRTTQASFPKDVRTRPPVPRRPDTLSDRFKSHTRLPYLLFRKHLESHLPSPLARTRLPEHVPQDVCLNEDFGCRERTDIRTSTVDSLANYGRQVLPKQQQPPRCVSAVRWPVNLGDERALNLADRGLRLVKFDGAEREREKERGRRRAGRTATTDTRIRAEISRLPEIYSYSRDIHGGRGSASLSRNPLSFRAIESRSRDVITYTYNGH